MGALHCSKSDSDSCGYKFSILESLDGGKKREFKKTIYQKDEEGPY